jgi:hypothetical protein
MLDEETTAAAVENSGAQAQAGYPPYPRAVSRAETRQGSMVCQLMFSVLWLSFAALRTEGCLCGPPGDDDRFRHGTDFGQGLD